MRLSVVTSCCAAGLMLLLAACAAATPTPTALPTPTPTSSPIPTSTPTPPPTPTRTPLPTPTPTPTPVVHPNPPGRTGGRLTVVALANLPHLDVHQHVQPTLASLGPGIVYSRLLRLRTGSEEEIPQPSLLLECDLCESWQMVDPFTYRFQLRQGVRWQDIQPVGARELTAEDVVYSYNRQRTTGFPNAPLLQNLERVEAEGPYALKISLKPGFPDADFLVSLADGHTKVVAREAVELNGDLKQGPVIGTGPWIWKSTEDDIGSVFERNPDYFEAGLPFLDEFATTIVKGREERHLAAFVTSEVDVYRVPPEGWEQFTRTACEFNSFLSRQGGSGLLLSMNVSSPPFNNPQVRRAVLRALDPWDYLDNIWKGQGFVSLGVPVARPEWLLIREETRRTYFADPSDARRILQGVELPKPIGFELTVADFGPVYLEQGRAIEEDLRSVGFNPVSVRVTSEQYDDRVRGDRAYQMAIGVLPPTSTTNSYLLATLYGAAGPRNLVRHSDTELDDLIIRQAVESDPATRGALVRDIQRHLLERAYLFSPVTGGTRWVSDVRVKGLYPNTAASEYFHWAKTWVEE